MFLVDAHAQKGTHFVLLGGDEPLIPMRRVLDHFQATLTAPPDSLLPTDQYYACLAGDWNADGDVWWGELNEDAPSFVPDLAVGRAPVLTVADAHLFVQKTLIAMALTVPSPRVLLEGSLTQVLDYAGMTEALVPSFNWLSGATLERLYVNSDAYPGSAFATPQTLVDSLGAGFDLSVLVGPGGVGVFELQDIPYAGVNAAELGALANPHPQHVMTMSAYTARPGAPSVAAAMLLDPQGGATTFIGQTSCQLSYTGLVLVRNILDQLYGTGVPTLGEALRMAVITSNGPTLSDYTRLTTQGTVLYGDPALGAPGGFGGPVAIAVSLATADAASDRVTLVWYAAGGANLAATVERQDPGAAWRALGGVTEDGAGRLRFVDRDVAPGERYGYRLRFLDAGVVQVAGVAWVTVPAPTLALAGARPNPATRELAIAFTLPDASPARLELVDLAGRRIATREVGALGAGEHVVDPSDGHPPAAGVYFVRLVRGGRVLTSRVAIVR
jgi:hypothetical protein